MDWSLKKMMAGAADKGDFEAFKNIVDAHIGTFDRQDWEIFLFSLSLVKDRDVALCRKHRDAFVKARDEGVFRYISFGAAVRAEMFLEKIFD